MERITPMLDRLHAIVIGPGLGRDIMMQETAGRVIAEARKRGMPVVVDAVCVLASPRLHRQWLC